MLTTEGLSIGFRRDHKDVVLLSDLNLHLERGHLVALLGRNGAGKSTLLRTLTSDTHPIDGKVCLAGVDVWTLSQRERSRLIGLVSTERIGAGGLTVRELVAMGRQPYTGLLGRLDKHDWEVVAEAMHDVGLDQKAEQYVASLSDGERQKAMIARALVQRTPVIVLDEPTAFLDVASRIEVMQLLRSLAHEQNKAILLSSHDVSQSLMLADDLWLITRDGRLVAGETQKLIETDVMDRLFDRDSIRFDRNLLDYQAVE